MMVGAHHDDNELMAGTIARQVADGYQGAGEETVYYERKFLAPDGVVIDLTDHGWAGARGDV